MHKYEATTESVTAEDVKMWRRYLHSDRREAKHERRVSEGSEETEDEARRDVNVLEEPPRRREEREEGTEGGYEASEEESTVETGGRGSVKLVPLAAVTLTHPHIFVSLSSAQHGGSTPGSSPLKGFHLIASLAASLLRRDHYKRIDA